MTFFIASYNNWFYLTILLLIFIKFITEHVFRIDNKRKDVVSGCFVVKKEKEDATHFKFKFDYQVPHTINYEKDIEGKSTNISKYCSMSEKDCGGSLENTGAATFQVHESFSDDCRENFHEDIMLEDKDVEEFSDSVSDSDSTSSSDDCSVKNHLENGPMFVSDRVEESKRVRLPISDDVNNTAKTGSFQEIKQKNDELNKEYENVWEHDDLIDQLKKELKRVKGFGLATIYEESESPKSIDDVKAWKSVEKEKMFMVNIMNELHRYHKSYRERMRKLDVLNYEKMYSICFLNLKDPLELIHKPVKPSIMSNVLSPYLNKSNSDDSSKKFMKEVQSDLESVYVGQTCISWEILCWQHEKAREMQDCDPYSYGQFNQTAIEFQQFQVTLQRFIENESVQGTRLQNYVKNRCVLQTLLQVPVIAEDQIQDRTTCSDAITSQKLEEIMEDSIRIFWEFVKADRDEASTVFKGLVRNQVQHQNSFDFTLMSNIMTLLHKKEKKVKDILKTENCVVKKLKKKQESRSNCEVLQARIDMKLISRVLKMSRITNDQLRWCSKKLNSISFEPGKIQRVSSFSLFPC